MIKFKKWSGVVLINNEELMDLLKINFKIVFS